MTPELCEFEIPTEFRKDNKKCSIYIINRNVEEDLFLLFKSSVDVSYIGFDMKHQKTWNDDGESSFASCLQVSLVNIDF